jgi:rhodanese-related sulfurtransferase
VVPIEIGPVEAAGLEPTPVFLDVRERYEYEAGHIEDSVHVPIGDITARWIELDRSGSIVVVCQIGQRSALVADFLERKGLTARNLKGGLTMWSAEGLPLTTGSSTGTVVDGYARDIDGNRLTSSAPENPGPGGARQ